MTGRELIKLALDDDDEPGHYFPHPLAPYGLIPAGAAVGANAPGDGGFIRNTALGALTGAGMLGGGYLGGKLTNPEDKPAGTVLGGIGGGLTSLLAAQAALRMLFPPRRKKQAASPAIRTMQELKTQSDRRNYGAKHEMVRKLLQKYPRDFHVDSDERGIIGLTHKSGFRFHVPRTVMPTGWQSMLGPQAVMNVLEDAHDPHLDPKPQGTVDHMQYS